MIFCMVFSLLGLLSADLTLEAAGGLVLPGSPESDTPALNLDLRMKTGILPNWNIFLAGSFWGVKNFHQTEPVPDFIEFSTHMGYEVFGEYEETHRGFQLGLERKLGPVFLELAGGSYSRNVMVWLPGTGKRYGEDNYEESGFMSSFSLGIPAGDLGVLRIGTLTEGFEDWFFSVSAGISVTIAPPEGGQR